MPTDRRTIVHTSLVEEADVPHARRLAETLLVHGGFETERLEEVLVALDELFANTVQHGEGDRVATLIAIPEQRTIRFTLTQSNAWDPPGPNEPHDLLDERGRGLPLINALLRVPCTRLAGGRRCQFTLVAARGDANGT